MLNNKMSVVLATHNEEENLEKCLKAVKSIASEIVVVDGSSTDRTVEIARKFGARVIETDNPQMFHINKQKGLVAAREEWILQLDADEVVGEELAEEMNQVVNLTEEQIQNRRFDPEKKQLFIRHQKLLEERDGRVGKAADETVAFFVPRRNLFLGKFLKYGGTYPDGVIRLVKNHKARFPCKSVHEQIEIFGRVDWLENDLLHYDSPTFSKYLMRANRYTTLTADELERQNTDLSLFNWVKYVVWKPVDTFSRIFILHAGFRDGFRGFAWALFSGLHWPVAYFKYRSRRKG